MCIRGHQLRFIYKCAIGTGTVHPPAFDVFGDIQYKLKKLQIFIKLKSEHVRHNVKHKEWNGLVAHTRERNSYVAFLGQPWRLGQGIKAYSILMAYATERYVTHWTSSACTAVVMLKNIRTSYQQGNNLLFELLPFAQGLPYCMVLSVKVRDYGWLITLILCLDIAWGKPTFRIYNVGSVRHCNYMKVVRSFFVLVMIVGIKPRTFWIRN
jgi:hypothetical protein